MHSDCRESPCWKGAGMWSINRALQSTKQHTRYFRFDFLATRVMAPPHPFHGQERGPRDSALIPSGRPAGRWRRGTRAIRRQSSYRALGRSESTPSGSPLTARTFSSARTVCKGPQKQPPTRAPEARATEPADGLLHGDPFCVLNLPPEGTAGSRG